MGTNGITKLWSHDFWRICIANFMLSVSLYMLWPILPIWMMSYYGATPLQAGGIMALFGVALFILGPTFSYLVDTYKRKYMLIGHLNRYGSNRRILGRRRTSFRSHTPNCTRYDVRYGTHGIR